MTFLDFSLDLKGTRIPFICGINDLVILYETYILHHRVVVVANYELIQEIGSREELSGRPLSSVIGTARGSRDPENPDICPGVIASRGQVWQQQRRFALHTLRDLGFGKNGVEDNILDEVKELSQYLESSNGKPINIRNKFNLIILNALWIVVTGERIKPDSPRQQEIIKMFDNFVQGVDNPLLNLINDNKTLLQIAQKLNYQPPQHIFSVIRNFMKEVISPLKQSYQEDSLRNFVDHYHKMTKTQEKTGEQNSFVGIDGDINLENVLVDFFVAGNETTSTTLNWAMLYMILNPGIQERVHKELDDIIGKGVQPRFEDRHRTPYIEAVIHEVQRLGNIANRAVPHASTKDCHLSNGYYIPKDTVIFCWLGAVQNDPQHFPDPSKFDPTRYLDGNGAFKPHPKVIPFGLGKRRCLGETLAKMELYDFFTGIMMKFKVEKANPNDELSTAPREGAVLSPKPYKLRFILRD